jgi:leucyl-tRNA synthetase
VAALMALRNTLKEARRQAQAGAAAWNEAIDNLLLLLAPIAPHVTEELWQRRGGEYSIHTQAWPTWDEEVAKEDTIELVIQVNGRVRDKIEVAADLSDEELKQTALASDKAQTWLDGRQPRKVIVVKGKLVNIVV